MAEFLKTPKNLILPDVEKIEDPEVKKVCEEYNKAFNELIIAVYSDFPWLHKRIYDLEHP